MPNYQNGKVYKLYSLSNPNLVYVGSTTQPLSKRLVNHKSMWKKWKKTGKKPLASFEIFENCNDYRIELIELCPCDSREELLRTEGKYIQQHSTLNQQIAGRTSKEWRESNREKIREKNRRHYEATKARHKILMKKWREDNKEDIKEWSKHYYKDTKELILKKNKEYYDNNKEKISARRKVNNITCECGRVVRKGDIQRHRRSNIHKKRVMTK